MTSMTQGRENVSTEEMRVQMGFSPPRRNINNVQRVVRTLIWFGLFIPLGILTVIVGFILAAVHPVLGLGAFAVGGLISLIVPGMISSSLYIIPEFQRLVVLKLGKFVGVKGPGRLWVLPYPPFYESVAAIIDTRVRTRDITAAQTLTADNVATAIRATGTRAVDAASGVEASPGRKDPAKLQAFVTAARAAMGLG